MVNNAISQRYLRPNNYQLDPLLLSYLSQPLYITGANIQILSKLCCPSIARGDINLFYFWALG